MNITLVQFEPIDGDLDEILIKIWRFQFAKYALNYITHFKTVSVREYPQSHTPAHVRPEIRIFYHKQLSLFVRDNVEINYVCTWLTCLLITCNIAPAGLLHRKLSHRSLWIIKWIIMFSIFGNVHFSMPEAIAGMGVFFPYYIRFEIEVVLYFMLSAKLLD